MTLNPKINHTNGISVFKLVKNEVLYKILGRSCQKLKIQDGQRKPFWIDANKHIKEKKCVTFTIGVWSLDPQEFPTLHSEADKNE